MARKLDVRRRLFGVLENPHVSTIDYVLQSLSVLARAGIRSSGRQHDIDNLLMLNMV